MQSSQSFITLGHTNDFLVDNFQKKLIIFIRFSHFLQQDFVLFIPSASFYLLVQFRYQFVLKLQRLEGN